MMSGRRNTHERRDPNTLNRDARPYLPSTEQQEKVSRLRELYRGRFSEDGIAELLQYLDWDERESAKHLQELPPSDQEIEQDDPQLKVILTNLRILQSNGLEDILHLTQTGKIKTPCRLFACADCQQEWWKRIPARKQVSKCSECNVKYDPIPVEFEWGWAIFICPCGNEFSGFGQMGKTESRCYICGTYVKPSKIKPPEKKGPPKSRSRHQCNAPDCHSHRATHDDITRGMGRLNPGFGSQRGGAQGAVRRGTRSEPPPPQSGARAGAWNSQCVHPEARRQRSGETRMRVLMGSRKHVSTGSTVDTFLPQNIDHKETIFAPPLGGISEEDED